METTRRSVYLITYFDAYLEKVPTREAFADVWVEPFRHKLVAHWACCLESLGRKQSPLPPGIKIDFLEEVENDERKGSKRKCHSLQLPGVSCKLLRCFVTKTISHQPVTQTCPMQGQWVPHRRDII